MPNTFSERSFLMFLIKFVKNHGDNPEIEEADRILAHLQTADFKSDEVIDPITKVDYAEAKSLVSKDAEAFGLAAINKQAKDAADEMMRTTPEIQWSENLKKIEEARLARVDEFFAAIRGVDEFAGLAREPKVEEETPSDPPPLNIPE